MGVTQPEPEQTGPNYVSGSDNTPSDLETSAMEDHNNDI